MKEDLIRTTIIHPQDIVSLVESQRQFFRTGATLDLNFRQEQLKRLYGAIKKNEKSILHALANDMQKPDFEAYAGEVGFVLEECRFTLKYFRKWAKPQRVSTPITSWIASSSIRCDPHGNCLIIGPWNYPFQLIIAPLIGAIAAGNTAILKPSEIAPHTEKVIQQLIGETFDRKFIATICGGVTTTTALLEQKFNHIFFTGGTAVGKVVMTAAAKHLTPVILELGGKSPAIVDRDTDLDVTAKRLTWGKFYNAGQTCVAPDYLLVHKSVKDELLKKIDQTIEVFFGKTPLLSPHLASIIDDRHFDRLTGLLATGKVWRGGQSDRSLRRIAPTILVDVNMNDPIMADEIFGPILPVMTFENLESAIDIVKQRPNPLALYFFSKDKVRQDRVMRELAFGGGCINDTLLHLSNPQLPFGGIGPSGMGGYHGKFSFEVFSHKKGILKRTFGFDPPVRYPPYQSWKSWLIRWLMR